MKIYCPTCSRSSEDARFIGSFCEYCIAEKIAKQISNNASINICNSCKKIRLKGHDVEQNPENISTALSGSLKTKCSVFLENNPPKKGPNNLHFVCNVDNDKVEFDKLIELKITGEMCKKCYRIRSGYYEAVVQLRGSLEKSESMLERISRYLKRCGGFVAKVEHKDGGLDVYASSKEIMNEFFRLRHINPKRSYILYGAKNGKEVYRNIYLVRL